MAWAAAKAKVALEEVDIEADDAVLGRYGLRIPVVLGPGEIVLAEGMITDRKAVLKAIRRLKGR